LGESLSVELLTRRRRDEAVAYLSRDPLRNLLLIDLVESVGRPAPPAEIPAEVLVGRDGDRICGVIGVRPSLVLDAALQPSALDAFLPRLEGIATGLVKSPEAIVDALWERLAMRGRRAMIDRIERACVIERGSERKVEVPAEATLRSALDSDLDDLVTAARASLREEGRPDPFDGDPVGFRRWVRGRLHRARVVEVAGRVVFVGYADVRRRDGWLVQGVYTWPEQRRRGYAEAGMSALIREAFDSGAEHLQLAVVAGNRPAEALYRRLGFRFFADLRTILFA
jgi:ribosomal protein S18 acetylase RimI-like enzyme